MKFCSVKGCFNAKAKPECRNKTFFSFPLKNPELLKLWLQNIRRHGFMLNPSTSSVICSDHFEEDSFTVCLFRKRRILKKKAVPTIFTKTPKKALKVDLQSESKTEANLQPDETKPIIPVALYKSSIVTNVSPFNPSEPSSAQENPDDEGKIKTETLSLLEQVKKEECEQISTPQEPDQKLNLNQSDYVTIIRERKASECSSSLKNPDDGGKIKAEALSILEQVKKEEFVQILSPREPDENLNLNQSNYVTIKTERSPSEPSSAQENPDDEGKIKAETLSLLEQVKKEVCEQISTPQEPNKKSNLNPSDYVTIVTERKAILLLPIIGNQVPSILAQKPPVKTTIPVPSKLTATAYATAISDSLEKTEKKIGTRPRTVAELLRQKTHSLEKLASSSSKKSTGHTPNVTQAKLTKPPMPSKRKDRPHPLAGTSKVGHSTSPTENDGNATREMFESLFDGSENNPLFGSSTSERPGDLFDMFADYVAVKLREMDWDNCSYALRSILDVISKAGRAQHASKASSDISSPASSSKSSDQK